MRHLLDVAATGVTALLLHPLRSLVTLVALVTVLLPYLVGLGIARGVRHHTRADDSLAPL